MSESKLIRSRSKNAFANNLNAEPNIKKDRNNNSSASNDFSRTYNKKNKKHQKNEKKSINPTPLVESYHSYHHVRDSLLSSSSGYTNYRGILNLCVVLLVMSTGRLVLENIMKYGFLVRFDIPIRFIKDPTAWPSLLVIVCSNLFIWSALLLEKKLAKKCISEKTGNRLCSCIVTIAIFLPAAYLWYRKANPISSFFALATYTCLSMKLISYFQVNKTHRILQQGQKTKSSDSKEVSSELVDAKSNVDPNLNESVETNYISDPEDLNHSPQPFVHYPDNLNLKDIYYFMAVPTLCYEINFPRAKRIRKRFLIRRITEIIFLSGLELILLQQWIVPILQNSKHPLRETNYLKIFERLLKLAVPNHVIWLIGFYAFFHSYLNILAEVLRFGDRQFYKDWWNADTVALFWKNWNIPVHNFCSRHIYKPLLSQGITKFQASLIVFLISAFFHEYLVSIPLRMFRLWSFLGMLLQIPFAAFVNKFLHGNYGNMAVWVSLIIGQPIAIMMYIHDYYYDFFLQTSD